MVLVVAAAAVPLLPSVISAAVRRMKDTIASSLPPEIIRYYSNAGQPALLRRVSGALAAAGPPALLLRGRAGAGRQIISQRAVDLHASLI
jgi:hypothetical protein